MLLAIVVKAVTKVFGVSGPYTLEFWNEQSIRPWSEKSEYDSIIIEWEMFPGTERVVDIKRVSIQRDWMGMIYPSKEVDAY